MRVRVTKLVVVRVITLTHQILAVTLTQVVVLMQMMHSVKNQAWQSAMTPLPTLKIFSSILGFQIKNFSRMYLLSFPLGRDLNLNI